MLIKFTIRIYRIILNKIFWIFKLFKTNKFKKIIKDTLVTDVVFRFD